MGRPARGDKKITKEGREKVRLKIIRSQEREKAAAETDEESALVARGAAEPPDFLNPDGLRVWNKAAQKRIDEGNSVEEYAEGITLMAYAWQKYIKRIKRGGELKTAEIKSMTGMLHDQGLMPAARYKGPSKEHEPKRKLKRPSKSKVQEVLNDIDELDDGA